MIQEWFGILLQDILRPMVGLRGPCLCSGGSSILGAKAAAVYIPSITFQRDDSHETQPLSQLQRQLRRGFPVLREGIREQGSARYEVPRLPNGRTDARRREGHGGPCALYGWRHHGHGFGRAGRPLQQPGGLCRQHQCRYAGGSRTRLRGYIGRRRNRHADTGDLLGEALRHGNRPLWHTLDGQLRKADGVNWPNSPTGTVNYVSILIVARAL